jgi:N-acetyl-alpha-D-muramate 1-phosphate uridylyltransferase
VIPIIVLAGGLATRLRPITEHIPKSLIEINGIPFVLHQLKLFKRQGIEWVHFCLGHLGERVEHVIESSIFSKEMRITYSYDGDKLLGTGGAIMKAIPQLPEQFFITYGDSYLEIDYKDVERYFRTESDEKSGLMTIYNNSGKFDTSNVFYEKDEIILYSKKVHLDEMNYIDYGLGILKKHHFSGYSTEKPFDLSEIYENLSINKSLKSFVSQTRFYEIGSWNGIQDISNHLKKQL